MIENYKNEYNEKLKEFDNSIKNLKEFVSKMKENMEKANQKVIEFKTLKINLSDKTKTFYNLLEKDYYQILPIPS